MELVEGLKKLRLCHCKPGYLLEEVCEVMFADVMGGSGLFAEVIRLLDFGVGIPTEHNGAILSIRQARYKGIYDSRIFRIRAHDYQVEITVLNCPIEVSVGGEASGSGAVCLGTIASNTSLFLKLIRWQSEHNSRPSLLGCLHTGWSDLNKTVGVLRAGTSP